MCLHIHKKWQFSLLLRISFLTICLLTTNVFAVKVTASEYKIKGVFLLNLTKFITWPSEVFDPQKNFNICILGRNYFKTHLEFVTKNEKVQGSRIEIYYFNYIYQVGQCHILFISASEEDRLSDIFQWIEDRAILTVSDIEQFIEKGGMVEFFSRRKKIRLAIDAERVKKVDLHVSATLLKIARTSSR